MCHVNGVEKSTRAVVGVIDTVPDLWRVGSGGFSGVIDEIQTHNRVLSAAELISRYQLAPKVQPSQGETPKRTTNPDDPSSYVGVPNTTYAFNFRVYDSDGDLVKYRIDWGTGTTEDTGYMGSGTLLQATKSWTSNGSYSIMVRAIEQDGITMGDWSPVTVMKIETAVDAEMTSPWLVGWSASTQTSTNYKAEFVAGENAVGQSGSTNYKAQLGFAGGISNPSPTSTISLGGQGTGGGEPMPPSKVSIASFINLTGVGGEVATIANGLKQNGPINPVGTDGRYLSAYKDANGNLLVSGERWIKYDEENRPIKIITADGNVTDMVYDYEGNRVKKTVNGTSALYIGDIYEKTGSTVTTHIFAGGQRIASKTGSTLYYFHQDHLGSTSLMTNSVGAVLQTTRYTPFGNVYLSSGVFTDIGFTGHRFDMSDGLIYMKARYYDPMLGRFLTPDSIVQAPFDPQMLNRYTYVRNNPVNLIDPDGHRWKWWHDKVEKAAHKIANTKAFNITMGVIMTAVTVVVAFSPAAPFASIPGAAAGYFFHRAGANVNVDPSPQPLLYFGGGNQQDGGQDQGDTSPSDLPSSGGVADSQGIRVGQGLLASAGVADWETVRNVVRYGAPSLLTPLPFDDVIYGTAIALTVSYATYSSVKNSLLSG